MIGQKLLSSLLALYLIGTAANAFTQTSVSDNSKQVVTEAAPGAEQEIAPVKTEKIDKVGEKVVNSGLENIAKRPHIRWLTNN